MLLSTRKLVKSSPQYQHHHLRVSVLALLVQAVPNHMVGRLSRALLHICKKDNAAALALLTLVPRQLGTLGLLKGMAAITEALSKVDAQVDKVGHHIVFTVWVHVCFALQTRQACIGPRLRCHMHQHLLAVGGSWQAKAQPTNAKCWL